MSMDYLYLIINQAQANKFKLTEIFTPNDQGYGDNFIHLSKKEQVQFVLDNFYKDDSDVVILKVKYTQELSKNIIWEGKPEKFPHLYSNLSYKFIV